MKQKIFLLIISLLVLSNCTNSPFSRSKDGFDDQKRRPYSNKKHISKAKKNIIEDYDDDIYSEDSDDFVSSNRMMYRDMAEQDMIRRQKLAKKRKIYQQRMHDIEDEYDDIPQSYVDSQKRNMSGKSSEDLKKELSEIKKMLSETKKDMAKYKCPVIPQQNPKEPAASHDKGVLVSH
jgi:DNA repair exonuclease SbcCD ATPase subunit